MRCNMRGQWFHFRPVAPLSYRTQPPSDLSLVADVPGTYVARLVVRDGQSTSPPDDVTIVASNANARPIANAGADQNVTIGSLVTLDGSGSSDANGDAIGFQWIIVSRPNGSAMAISGETDVKPTIVPDEPGEYVVGLRVSDGAATSEMDPVTVNVALANVAPNADAGPDQNVVYGTVVSLDGSGSSDANGDALIFQWSLTSQPAGSQATLSDSAAVNPQFATDLDGTYVASLMVTDSKGATSIDTVTIAATWANATPIANAGVDQIVPEQALVQLEGRGSTDADGDTLVYKWTFVSFASPSQPTLYGSASNPSFYANYPGSYVLGLVVNDGSVDSLQDNVIVTTTDEVGPTPAGTGLVIGRGLNIFVIDERTMTKYGGFAAGNGYPWTSMDQGPDGVILATTATELYEINAQTGWIVPHGGFSEWVVRIAISPQGEIFAMSQDTDRTTGGHRLYRVSSSGNPVGYVLLSGDSVTVHGMDFGPDGRLYGIRSL